ncbi:MAG: lipoprotein [Wenzhouxiangellaceae bacterium]|nr:lipoprotein [Wenzhouxiangellaceae bacterium]
MRLILPAARAALLTLLLAGCGLKGDLYLPEPVPEPEPSGNDVTTTEADEEQR